MNLECMIIPTSIWTIFSNVNDASMFHTYPYKSATLPCNDVANDSNGLVFTIAPLPSPRSAALLPDIPVSLFMAYETRT